MIYKVYADEKILYYPGDEEATIIGGEINQALNDSGSFEFELTKLNPLNDQIFNRQTMIRVLKGEKEIFCGEVRESEKDIDGIKQIYCVGEMAFLLDSVQPQKKYQDYSPRQFLEELLNYHNSMTEEKKHFEVGIVTVHDTNDSIYRFTNREKTLDAIREKLCDSLNGYLKVRKENGKRYLDLLRLEDYGKQCEQPIRFGENMLDYTENMSGQDIVTALIPLGKRLDESKIEGLDSYTDITEVNGGKEYLYIDEAVKKFGWNWAVVKWNDVAVPENLKKKGEEWLSREQFEKLVLNIKAFDFSFLEDDVEAFELGDRIRTIAEVYGMDIWLPMQKRTIYIQEWDKNTVQLGSEKYKTYSEHTAENDKNVENELEKVHGTTDFLASAIDNATQMMTGSKGGYKVTEYDENGRWLRDLYMSAPSKEEADYVMQINMNGIGFSRDGFDGPYKNAWTIDGVFTGEFIKAGSVQAEALSVEYKESVEKEIENAETGAKEYAESFTTTEIKALEGRINLRVREELKYVYHDYIVNGDFSNQLESWYISNATYVSLFESEILGRCVKFEIGSTASYLRTYIKGLKLGKYKVRFKAATTEGYEGSARLRINFNGINNYTTVAELKADAWTEYEFEYENAADANKYLYFYNSSSSAPVLVTDVKLLGSYETYNESQIKLLSDSIESKVSAGDFSSYVTQYYDRVITAFNNSSKYVQITAGAIEIYDAGVETSKKRAMFDEDGNHFYRDGYYIGKIGTNQWVQNNAHKGLVFDLDTDGKYMSWAYEKSSTDNFYTMIWTLSRAGSVYDYLGLWAGVDVFMGGYDLYLGSDKKHKVYNYNNGLALSDAENIFFEMGSTTKAFVDNEGLGISGGSGLTAYNNTSLNFYSDLNMNGYSVLNNSDERLKKNISDMKEDALSILNRVAVMEYDWRESGEHVKAGVIAQQLMEVLPEAVAVSEKTGICSVKNDVFIPYLIRAVQQIIEIMNGGAATLFAKYVPGTYTEEEIQKALLAAQPPEETQKEKGVKLEKTYPEESDGQERETSDSKN